MENKKINLSDSTLKQIEDMKQIYGGGGDEGGATVSLFLNCADMMDPQGLCIKPTQQDALCFPGPTYHSNCVQLG